ncbi:polysaccharide polymerase [Acetobacter sp. DsW_063]|uniref:polysaccharide polymerase n=1 Tax=Acetobacter sp. DsW_063 TaxID=1514894 RepID=UPI0018E9B3D1|nr:polysaccharide polymerase [Acetobacter sp. DsW_063]
MDTVVSPFTRTAGAENAATGKWIVVTSLMFNLGLCFLQTRGWLHASSATVAMIELLVIGAAAWCVRRQVTERVVVIAVLTTGYVVAAKMINPAESPKILHDLFIMYVFYCLGRGSGRPAAQWTVWAAMALVLTIGLFELLAPDFYGQLFNVWQYYVEKGVLSQDTVNYSGTTMFVSGNRGEGARTFLPSLLGSHRVSSVFLEPVSMGNFAALVFAWCLAVWRNRPGGRQIFLIVLAMVCIVLTDSRFASGCCVAMLLVRISPVRRSSLFVFLLPIGVVTALTIVGALHEIPGATPSILTDNLKGRLVFSGRLLDYWTLSPWFAFSVSPVYTADTGYAYIFNTLGAPLTLLYALIFAFHRNASRDAAVMKTMLAVYFSCSLCIGANSVTIKTAALLWFLYGALDAVPAMGWRQVRRQKAPASLFPVGAAACE